MEAPTSIKTALLQSLIRGPAYGLELMDQIAERTGGKVRANPGNVYPALSSLERQGFVEKDPRETTEVRRGRRRIYYKLTAEGAAAALEQRKVLGSLIGVEVPA